METRYLIVDEYGSYLRKHSERLVLHRGKELVAEAPLLTLEGVIVADRGTSLSADAVAACAEAGIPIHFVHSSGHVSASIFSAGLTGTVQTRRAQLQAADDGRSIVLAKAFATGKVLNQAALLRYLAKYRKERAPALYARLEDAARTVAAAVRELHRLGTQPTAACIAEEICPQILAIEGRAAAGYWEAIRAVVKVPADWPGRTGRGATDPVNAALNYGYGILYSQVERAIVLAGLDPYAGFIHADRPGKPSLVCDLIEEFRAPVVDRTIFAMINRGTQLAQDEENLLVKETRRAIAEAVLERLDRPERYERKKVALRHIIQCQARHIATFVRGERMTYRPFVVRW